jgi:hypothetical protein
VESEGRVRMGRDAMSGILDEERIGEWMMRLSWSWVVNEEIESRGCNS